MKRVLITGAGGFVGRHTVRLLQGRGYEVHAASRDPAPPDLREIPWHEADLLQPGGPRRLVESVRPSHLLHLAWYAEHGKFWRAPENLAFVQASLELVRAFREQGGTRAAIAGTCAEYDWSHGYCTEAVTPLRPGSPYGVCKDALRRLVEAHAALTGLSWSWARLFLLFGPHEDPRRLVPSVIDSMLAAEEVRLSHGNQIRDFLHVADVAAALAALLDCEVQGPVNVCSGVPTSIREVVGHLREILQWAGEPRFGALAAPTDDPPFLVGNPARLRDEVGFRPEGSLRSRLEETVTWQRRARTPR